MSSWREGSSPSSRNHHLEVGLQLEWAVAWRFLSLPDYSVLAEAQAASFFEQGEAVFVFVAIPKLVLPVGAGIMQANVSAPCGRGISSVCVTPLGTKFPEKCLNFCDIV